MTFKQTDSSQPCSDTSICSLCSPFIKITISSSVIVWNVTWEIQCVKSHIVILRKEEFSWLHWRFLSGQYKALWSALWKPDQMHPKHNQWLYHDVCQADGHWTGPESDRWMDSAVYWWVRVAMGAKYITIYNSNLLLMHPMIEESSENFWRCQVPEL